MSPRKGSAFRKGVGKRFRNHRVSHDGQGFVRDGVGGQAFLVALRRIPAATAPEGLMVQRGTFADRPPGRLVIFIQER